MFNERALVNDHKQIQGRTSFCDSKNIVHPSKIVITTDWAKYICLVSFLRRCPNAPKEQQQYRDIEPHTYSTQSAINTFVSPSFAPLRFEAKTSFLPSGENIGKPSNDSL